MPEWTLTHEGVTKTLRDWGMTQCTFEAQGMGAEIFTAQIEGFMTDELAWSFKDKVTLEYGGVVKFRGTALPPVRQGDGTDEMITCSFADPFWWMTQAAYTQDWWDANTASAYQAARVALFASVTAGTGWSIRSIGAEISAIVAHCNALFGGGKMQIGSLLGDGFALTPVAQRVENVTHEGAMRRALQWVPDGMLSWDHSFDPPKLNITQRTAATARSYSFADKRLHVTSEIRRRDDMVVNGVAISYLGVDASGNPSGFIDQAGATSGAGVLRTTVDMTGGGGAAAPSSPSVQPETDQNYDLVSDPIDVNDPAWWFEYGDTGAQSAADIIVVGGPGAGLDLEPDAPENEGKAGLGGCTRQWLSGSIPATLDAHTRVARAKQYLRVRTITPDPDNSSFETEIQDLIQIKVTLATTDLSEGSTVLLKDQTVSMGGGAGGAISYFAPAGIAAQLLASWNGTQYDGAFSITDDECSENIQVGDVVNMTDGLTEWSTMRAQVQSIRRNLAEGRTDIGLGVASHLPLNEFAGLIKIGKVSAALDLHQQAKGETPPLSPEPLTIPSMITPRTSSITVLRKVEKLRKTQPTWEFVMDFLSTEA